MKERGTDLFELKRKIDNVQKAANNLKKEMDGWEKLNQTCICPKCGNINEWEDMEKNEEVITLIFECKCGTYKKEIYQRIIDVIGDIEKEGNNEL